MRHRVQSCMETPGPYEAIVLADSIASGVRLTTLCCTFPRIVLAEFNTHRVFSRNSASSRAIPVKRRIAQIRENPYVPLQFGKNRRGMQAQDEEVADAEEARLVWLSARNEACEYAEELSRLGLHKQWANRLLESFAWHTVIVTATEWDNYFALRISEHAQPEIRKVSEAMKAAMDESTPEELEPGDWHVPLVETPSVLVDERDFDTLVKLCVARTATISYERHMEQNVDKELDRYDKLLSAGHMSPFEHAARVDPRSLDIYHQYQRGEPECIRCGAFGPTAEKICPAPVFIGNFRAPWHQHRKMLPGEAVFGSMG